MPAAGQPVVAILGPGLLGGSLALALRRRLPEASVRIWARRDAAVREILDRGLADCATSSVIDAVDGASLVILATPVGVMAELTGQVLQGRLRPGCTVTDVGSVKGSVVAALEPLFAGGGAHFVGSHPMAGSEKAGLGAAREDLFDGAACIVTPTAGTNATALEQVTSFWRLLGCSVLQMSAAEHDRRVARISHLPHVMAAITTLAALRADPSALPCAGNGFRDTTRVAAGDPALWSGILLENRAEVAASLRDALDTTRELLEMVEGMDEEKLRLLLAEARSLRERLSAGGPAHGHP